MGRYGNIYLRNTIECNDISLWKVFILDLKGNGFNINFALGYGFSSIKWNSKPSSDSIDLVLEAFEDEYDFFDPFLGELSIGFAF